MNKNINKLPVEIILKEFEMLDYDSLINVCSIDRRFKAICDQHEDYLYKKMIARDIFTSNNQEFINSLNIDTNIKPKKLYVLYSSHLIFKAIDDNNLIELEKLLRLKNINVNVTNDSGETPLHIASKKGDLEIVKFLVEKGADVNVKGSGDRTPLMSSSEDGHLEIVKFLVNEGADVNAKDDGGYTALMLCILGTTKLKIVEFLVEKGADVNAKDHDDEEATALHIASFYGMADIVKFLVSKGADVNATNSSGQTARMIANERREGGGYLTESYLEIEQFLIVAEKQAKRGSEIFRCKYCNKGLSTPEKLVMHLEDAHTEQVRRFGSRNRFIEALSRDYGIPESLLKRKASYS